MFNTTWIVHLAVAHIIPFIIFQISSQHQSIRSSEYILHTHVWNQKTHTEDFRDENMCTVNP